MSLGVIVNTSDAPPSRGAPVNTGTWFAVGEASSGPTDAPTLVRSISQFRTAYGARSGANAKLYDALDDYFREEGRRAYVARIPTDGEPADGLALLGKTLGPGQVSVPGEADALTHATLFTHAEANNRYAVCDTPDTDDVAELLTVPANAPANLESYGAFFGPFVQTPGPAGVVGVTSREVAGSASIAALCARIDATGNPNQAAAGRDLPLQYATGFKYEFSDEDHETLLDAGVNLFKPVFGVLENYGFQTALTPDDDPVYWQANCGRMRMALKAQAYSIGESFMFKPLDGKGYLEARFQTALEGMLAGYHGVNALFGETAAEAYRVEVGSSVNTIDTVAQGELHAVAEVKLSLHARAVIVDLVSVPLDQAISA